MDHPPRHAGCDGGLRVHPPLSSDERLHLRRVSIHPAGRGQRPGDVVPFAPSPDGRVLRVIPAEAGAEPIAEWAAFLVGDLGGPGDEGRTRVRGEIRVQGASPSDRWTLQVDAGRVVVSRTTLPCPRCWSRIVRCAPDSEAYRFVHPDPVPGSEARDPLDARRLRRPCPADGWLPLEGGRRVFWPPAELDSGTPRAVSRGARRGGRAVP